MLGWVQVVKHRRNNDLAQLHHVFRSCDGAMLTASRTCSRSATSIHSLAIRWYFSVLKYDKTI